jgi:hypothetical protein
MSKKKSLKKKAAATVDVTANGINLTLLDCLILLNKQKTKTLNILQRHLPRGETNPTLMRALAELIEDSIKVDRAIKTLDLLQEAITKAYLRGPGRELDPALEDA